MPQITVIMPMKNAERFVRASAESVLSQTGVDLELVIVDDGSTDRSAEVVRAIQDGRIVLIAGPQRGISAAVNAGLAVARGRFVARCDSDDFFRPGRLARQQHWLDSHPDFVAVGAGYSYLDAHGRFGVDRIADDGTSDVTTELRAGVGRSHMGAYLFRTDALKEVGGCREWFVTSEDADLQFRLAGLGKVGYDAFDAYGYRLHDASITHTQKGRQKQWYAEMAKRFLDQRNAGERDDLERELPPRFVDHANDAASERGANELTGLMISRAWEHHRFGRRRDALKVGRRIVRLKPTSLMAWKNLALLAIKR